MCVDSVRSQQLHSQRRNQFESSHRRQNHCCAYSKVRIIVNLLVASCCLTECLSRASREYRESILKSLSKYVEQTKISIRGVRQQGMKDAKKAFKSEDEQFRAEKEVSSTQVPVSTGPLVYSILGPEGYGHVHEDGREFGRIEGEGDQYRLGTMIASRWVIRSENICKLLKTHYRAFHPYIHYVVLSSKFRDTSVLCLQSIWLSMDGRTELERWQRGFTRSSNSLL